MPAARSITHRFSLERSVAEERAGVIGLELCEGRLRGNLAAVPVRAATGSADAWRPAEDVAAAVNRVPMALDCYFRRTSERGRSTARRQGHRQSHSDNFGATIQATRHGTGLDRCRSSRLWTTVGDTASYWKVLQHTDNLREDLKAWIHASRRVAGQQRRSLRSGLSRAAAESDGSTGARKGIDVSGSVPIFASLTTPPYQTDWTCAMAYPSPENRYRATLPRGSTRLPRTQQLPSRLRRFADSDVRDRSSDRCKSW